MSLPSAPLSRPDVDWFEIHSPRRHADPVADSADRYADQYARVKKTTVACDWSSVRLTENLPFLGTRLKSALSHENKKSITQYNMGYIARQHAPVTVQYLEAPTCHAWQGQGAAAVPPFAVIHRLARIGPAVTLWRSEDRLNMNR
jgi:hypothetical protein